MVIVNLMGGVGNQLFQYAAGRAIAHRKKVPFKLDLSWFKTQELRRYQLSHFNISAEIATQAEVDRLKGFHLFGLRRKIFRLYQHFLPYYKRTVFRERFFHFDPNILRCLDQVYLVGFWQSEKYFEDISNLIRQEFLMVHNQDSQNQKTANLINNTESVSIHVRRGDYVSNPKMSQLFATCGLDHYRKSVSIITKKVLNPHFYIFSDDTKWGERNLRLDHPTTYVKNNNDEKCYDDLHLMTLCKHHIIANSSFSWWAAWLSTNPRKLVIAPQKWFKNATHNTKDLIPQAWTLI